jgi:hypothetical protein
MLRPTVAQAKINARANHTGEKKIRVTHLFSPPPFTFCSSPPTSQFLLSTYSQHSPLSVRRADTLRLFVFFLFCFTTSSIFAQSITMADEVSRSFPLRASLRCLCAREKPPRNRLGCPSTERHPTSQYFIIFFFLAIFCQMGLCVP